MPNLNTDGHKDGANHIDGANKDGAINAVEKAPRTRGLLPQALEELQLSVEELRVADEEMRVQNEELSLSRLRLEAERQRYQDLFEFAPDGYLVTTLDGEILESNRAASRLLGISPRFLKKRSLGTLITLPSLTEFQNRLRGLTNPTEKQFGEWTVQLRRRPSGSFQAAVTAALFQGLFGQPPTLRWLIRDISERVRAEEERAALAQAKAAHAEADEVQRRTTEILEAVTDLHIALDLQWRVLSLNASAAHIIQEAGRDPAQVIGQVLWDLYPTSLGAGFEAETMQAVAAGQQVDFETFSQELGRWLQVRVFPTRSGVALYARDVTERRDAEAALRKAFEREKRIAETLRQILLYTPPPEAYPALAVETFYEAASEEAAVGGDFSDVFTYDDGKIALVIGDISGKGLGAATLIAEVKYALRAILREFSRPETAMTKLNDFVCEAQRQKDLGADHLVVLSLAVFDPETGGIFYLTAGGEPLLLVRADGGVEVIGTNGLLLGVQTDVAYTANQTQLAAGDTLLMVTDGLTEARRAGQMYGLDALQSQARQLQPGKTLRGLGEALIESARSWTGGTFQDDVCLLLARRPA